MGVGNVQAAASPFRSALTSYVQQQPLLCALSVPCQAWQHNWTGTMRLAVLGPWFNAWHDFITQQVVVPLRHLWYYSWLWDVAPIQDLTSMFGSKSQCPPVDVWIWVHCSRICVGTATTCNGSFCSKVSLPQDQHDTLARQDTLDAWLSQTESALLTAPLSHFTVASQPFSPSFPPPPPLPLSLRSMSPGHTVLLAWCSVALIPDVLTIWSDKSITKGDDECDCCCLLVEFNIPTR